MVFVAGVDADIRLEQLNGMKHAAWGAGFGKVSENVRSFLGLLMAF